MGQLVTDYRFSVVNPYSSRVHSTGPEGSLPFFEEKPWIVFSRDSNVARMPMTLVRPGTGHLPAYPFPPLTLKVPGAVVEPIGGPTFRLLGLDGL